MNVSWVATPLPFSLAQRLRHHRWPVASIILLPAHCSSHATELPTTPAPPAVKPTALLLLLIGLALRVGKTIASLLLGGGERGEEGVHGDDDARPVEG